jgi:alpha-beta hydrolase superfamily lysophospholipase
MSFPLRSASILFLSALLSALAKTDPKRPFWVKHGTSDAAVPFATGQGLADSLTAAGWPGVVFTPIQDAPHNWLWQPQFGHSNQELWDWFMQNPLP